MTDNFLAKHCVLIFILDLPVVRKTALAHYKRDIFALSKQLIKPLHCGGDFLVQSAHKAAEKVACEQIAAWLAKESENGWSFATKLRAHIVGEASAHGPAPVYEPLLFVFRKPAP